MKNATPNRPILPAQRSTTVTAAAQRANSPTKPAGATFVRHGLEPVRLQPFSPAIQPRVIAPTIVPPRPVVQPKPILATPPRPLTTATMPGHVTLQNPASPAAIKRPPAPTLQRSSSVSVSSPIQAGDGRYRIEASERGRPVGSLMVNLRNRGAAVVTDLNVDPSARGQGVGKALLGSAARAALQFGKGRVALASQDNGSGKLTGWYRGMGFRQVGVNQLGFPELEAPVSRVLDGGNS
jgi:hypothetical protein